jgi:hypothetical protein
LRAGIECAGQEAGLAPIGPGCLRVATDQLDVPAVDELHAAVAVHGAQVANVLAALVGLVVALVAAVAGGIGAGSGAGLTGLDAQSGTGLDRGEGRFGDAAAEDRCNRAGDGGANDGAARSTATDEFGQIIEPTIVHSISLQHIRLELFIYRRGGSRP